jgi:hypothetical protein
MALFRPHFRWQGAIVLLAAWMSGGVGAAQTILLDSFNAGATTGSVRTGTTWVGSVTPNATTLTVGGTARDCAPHLPRVFARLDALAPMRGNGARLAPLLDAPEAGNHAAAVHGEAVGAVHVVVVAVAVSVIM